ncbi:hypothetical protein PanWU01x14_065790 [Parasponia andersonii]|uniref:Uncharacterized protein n=1 Tax=Parasponia andersonii TaxID=3476 RepID=A0A2P5DGX6_PARAD|nr:hypothetical protein PanWU01x14_065790 [Parasponia andersonii]
MAYPGPPMSHNPRPSTQHRPLPLSQTGLEVAHLDPKPYVSHLVQYMAPRNL